MATENWSLGGGTALMLQIDHRHSFDIDIFFADVQLINFIVATVSDVNENSENPKYTSLSPSHVAIKYSEFGKIDYIYSGILTDNPFKNIELVGRNIKIQTVPEIITSKIVKRGRDILPRDIFDVASACSTSHLKDIEIALLEYSEEVAIVIKQIKSMRLELIQDHFNDLIIHKGYERLKLDAVPLTLSVLERVSKRL